jgi:hypothetical protein
MKYSRIIRRNGVVVGRIEPGESSQETTTETTCPYRGEQLRTITSVICSKKTIDLPVYACGLFGGECVHRQVCSDHDPAIRICVGCGRENCH